MGTVWAAAGLSTLEEFQAVYEQGQAANYVERDGGTLLTRALGNTANRSAICDFLLDEGADANATVRPDGHNALHILLLRALSKSHPENDESDVLLLRRLLDAGADVNAVDLKYGTPLQVFLENVINLRDERMAIPFYEVIFSRPDLDLMRVGAFNQSTFYSIWQASFKLTIMLDRAQRYLVSRV